MSVLRVEELSLPGAEVGPCNPLPPLARDADVHAGIRPAADVPPEDRRYVGYGTVASPLPYLMQDGYGRERALRRFLAVVIENQELRATFLPEVGGRLWSLVHLSTGRELLFRNPVFQPANLAIRNAWFAGGVEWNVGLVGHSPFTCSPLFAARVDGPAGCPVLRMYEWERIRRVTFQIDAWMPDGSPVLLVHVRIANPNDDETPMYWWSNMAVPETEGTRVIAPAEEAYTFAYGGQMRRVPIPAWEGVDRSYSLNGRFAADYFFRIPEGAHRWIAALDADGSGLFQTSTPLLRGRKLFLWGTSPGGRRWQEFLSEPGRAYLEIQAGLARTQAEHLPMPARSEWSWLEAYGRLDVRPEDAHSPDWARACSAVGLAVGAICPPSRLAEVERAFAPVLRRSPLSMLLRGSGWGALEALRRARKGLPMEPAGLVFDDTALGPEQEPWRTLLEEGRMVGSDSEAAIRGILVEREWRELLEASVAAGEGGWLPWYHLGVMRAYHNERDGAVLAFRESLGCARTAWALRNLALLERSRGNTDRAAVLLREALELRPALLPLAVECGTALLDAGRATEWLEMAANLPEEARRTGRIRLLIGRAWLEIGDLDALARFLEDPPEVADMREGEVSLSDLWFGMQELAESRRRGRALDEEARRRIRQERAPPRSIDFRVSTED